MNFRVFGCHGGETPQHRTSAFVLDGRLAIDAGSLTSGMELEEQYALEACLISHAHLDHVRDLATLADNRLQGDAPPLLIAGTQKTLATLKEHFFNNCLWPDFSVLPDQNRPTIQYYPLIPEVPVPLAGYWIRSVLVSHTIESSGFIIDGPTGTIAYSGDTGPTERFWQVLNEIPNLKALIMEVSFPNRKQELASLSGHHTPCTLSKELRKYHSPHQLPTFLYHLKPAFQQEIEKECNQLRGLNLDVLSLGDTFLF
ncbi:MBL fold metallo-hydrolase [Pajaroellobacter abortibovis]|uniref:3',5'-cyclic-nucleotide phosphodiesterase n=1 Tax=Pajaroellobacter abortibovis TaxID=1882918 RepID=A0A1L6MX17_9BACT|nr:3',5'-cyclic-nucleotide phosphodiesterase [Pajaroellobacter abortibovis]APS00087.1 3',5'-cyclic-nucleotide phosphodiesterase [Pajaroellobacter abortibovis]